MITTTTTTIKQQVEILKQVFIDLPKPWLPLALAPLADPLLPTGLLNRHHIREPVKNVLAEFVR